MVNTKIKQEHIAELCKMNLGNNIAPQLFTEELLAYTEKHIQQAITVYQNLTADLLNKPPVSGGWSITQCLAHLNSYYSYYLPLIEKALAFQATKPVRTVKRSWLGNYFTQMMDPDGKPASYKAATQHQPPTALDAHAVVAEFIAHQETLLSVLGQAASVDLNSNRIPTSISKLIKLRLGDTLAFLVVHNERHIRQADRNLGTN